MRPIFTSKERGVVLFLASLFLVGNAVRLYQRMLPGDTGRLLDLGTLEPADSAEVVRLLERSRELRREREQAENVTFPLNINTAEFWELTALPGIGPERAARIVEERTRRGRFHALTDLLAVPGIGDKTLRTLENYLLPIDDMKGKIEPDDSRTVDINLATPEQLESLPGIGPVLAKRIVTHRESKGPFRSFEDLMQVKGIGEERLKELEPFLSIR